MLCDRCKNKEAKIYYTEIVGGQKKEQHLCEECAADCSSFQLDPKLFPQDLPISSILSSILGSFKSEEKKESKQEEQIRCDSCGMTYQEFLDQSKFGCTNCYQSFGKMLPKNFKSIQGADRHTGKKPKDFVTNTSQIWNKMSELDRLNMKLQDAIEKEEFEEAARLRDYIRAYKEKTSEKQSSGREEVNNA